jgi:methylmalonyl-CoA mutase N-terminal domain/subunit
VDAGAVRRPGATARDRQRAKVLNGTTQNDIIKEYLSRGTYIFRRRRRCA